MSHVQPGMITLWSGGIGAIPANWALCDGTLGTPDLRDSFVVGAGSTYNPDDTGGSVNHDHTFTGDGHTHDITGGTGIQPGVGLDFTTSSDATTGTTDNGSSLPPFYALAYIMLL